MSLDWQLLLLQPLPLVGALDLAEPLVRPLRLLRLLLPHHRRQVAASVLVECNLQLLVVCLDWRVLPRQRPQLVAFVQLRLLRLALLLGRRHLLHPPYLVVASGSAGLHLLLAARLGRRLLRHQLLL